MADEKDLYELGETPPLGYVPKQMYANLIRSERFGDPHQAFDVEVVDTPTPEGGQVLVWVMAAGINYNNIWAGLGAPVDVIATRMRRQGAEEDFHIGGSDASGIASWIESWTLRRPRSFKAGSPDRPSGTPAVTRCV